jgi:hypothetical protein
MEGMIWKEEIGTERKAKDKFLEAFIPNHLLKKGTGYHE